MIGKLINKKQDKTIQEQIKYILNELELQKNIKGYYEWIIIINKAYNKDYFNLGDVIIEDLYKETAVMTKTTRDKVERNLRTAIGTNKKKIKKYFKYKYKITNRTFLILVLEKLVIQN